MSDTTEIQWADSTFNGWMGCTKVGPGCDHCYAAVSTPARTMGIKWGPGAQRRRTGAVNWDMPIKWNAKPFFQCEECDYRGDDFTGIDDICSSCRTAHAWCPVCANPSGNPSRRRVFSASLSDWLDNEVPIEWLVELLDLIRQTPNLDWLLLTKRIGNFSARLTMARYWIVANHDIPDGRHLTSEIVKAAGEYGRRVQFIEKWENGSPPPNVWLGATVVNQQEADRDIPKLLQVPAAVRFLSIEPMLGPINLHRVALPAGSGRFWIDCLAPWYPTPTTPALINWVICGGESGHKARPMQPTWVQSLRYQCVAAGVPFLFKQWGEWLPDNQNPVIIGKSGETQAIKVGKKLAGRKLDGRTWDQFPGVPRS